MSRRRPVDRLKPAQFTPLDQYRLTPATGLALACDLLSVNCTGDFAPGTGRTEVRLKFVAGPGTLWLVKMLTIWLPLAGAAWLLAGCHKPDNGTELHKLTLNDLLPRQAQPKLPTIKLYVGPEVLDAEMAVTQDQIETGMMYRTNIQETDSMIFVLPYTQRAAFWMMHCPESISVAYITPDGTIAEIHHLERNDTNSVYSATDNIRFALETKDGWFGRHHINPGMVIRTEKGTLAETFLHGQP